MSNLWFAADLHLGHESIVTKWKDASRPFVTIEEHNEAIIDNWNSLVGPRDVAWVLGDVLVRCDDLSLIDRLNGRKRLVPGNHDDPMIYPCFEEVWGVRPYRRKTILSHIPLHREFVTERWNLNIHGHLHTKRVMRRCYPGMEREDPHYLCVSLEQNGLKPFNWDQIKEVMRERGFKKDELTNLEIAA